jgi:hypothetical protein
LALTEPTTAITDFILGLELFVLSVLTLRRTNRQRCIFLWSIALLALGVSAIAGGLYHGLANNYGRATLLLFWRISMASIIATLGFMIASGLISALSGARLAVLFIVTEIPVVFYFYRAATQFEPHVVLQQSTYASLIIFFILVLLYVRHVYAKGPESGRWILIGSIIVYAGVCVQTLRFSFGANFNENDLCHIIFMIGSIFLYRGGILLRDHIKRL